MSDETFAEATMKKLRALEAENRKLKRENAILIERIRQQEADRHQPDWADVYDQWRRHKPYRHMCEAS